MCSLGKKLLILFVFIHFMLSDSQHCYWPAFSSCDAGYYFTSNGASRDVLDAWGQVSEFKADLFSGDVIDTGDENANLLIGVMLGGATYIAMEHSTIGQMVSFCFAGVVAFSAAGSAVYEYFTSECCQCFPGEYCVGEKRYICGDGYYCPHYGMDPSDLFWHECQAGMFCMDSYNGRKIPATTQISCPPGTYSGYGATHCTLCDNGHYCPYNGTSYETCLRKYCPAGKKCPIGTAEPLDCPIGTYSEIGWDHCDVCPAGYYCPNQIKKPCPEGSVCPTTGLTEKTLCPPGNFSRGTSWPRLAIACELCWAGYYCEHEGTRYSTMLIRPCWNGRVCPIGTIIPQGCGLAYYTRNYNELGERVETCEPCIEGYYCHNALTTSEEMLANWCNGGVKCPEGSILPIPCSTGEFSFPKSGECHECLEGHYCVERTSYDYMMFELFCPAGFFCPNGSALPQMCGVGQFSHSQSGDCESCIEGHYCPSTGTNYNWMLHLECPEGRYCPRGTNFSIPRCQPGSFSVRGQSICSPCREGYYCPLQGTTPSMELDFHCSRGFSCPEGSQQPQECQNLTTATMKSSECQDLCLPGTYAREYNGHFECETCIGGYYCDDYGLWREEMMLNGCPRNFYCPPGTIDPIPCPVGSISHSYATYCSGSCSRGGYISGSFDCEPCLEGYYCPLDGMGYLEVVQGSYHCLAGSYCPIGSVNPIPCPSGTFSYWFSSTCLNCIEKYFCPTEGTSHLMMYDNYCPSGYICPVGSVDPTICPNGTYSSGQTCNTCLETYYCPTEGIDYITMAVSLSCPCGYFCPEGSMSPIICPSGTSSDCGQSVCSPCRPGYYCGEGTITNFEKMCPEGSYCPEGSSQPMLCNSGSYSSQRESECRKCPKGFYCPIEGLTWRLESYKCKAGHYCVEGSSYPKLCPPGTYSLVSSPIEGPYECHNCTGGFYCPSGSSNMRECPGGYICPPKSGEPTPCQPGSYSTKRKTECSSCVAGYTCSNNGTSVNDMYGQICPSGSFCPEGSSEPTVCPNGNFSNIGESVSCYLCPSGWYCFEGEKIVCPTGSYCQEGSDAPIPCPDGQKSFEGADSCSGDCPPGGYLKYNHTSEEFTCLPCLEGYFCSMNGTLEEKMLNSSCEPGKVCPQGSANQNECPTGSCSYELASECEECSGGFYCNQTEMDCSMMQSCKPGFSCPPGVSEPIECIGGTFRTSGSSEICESCSAGFYCPPGSSEMIQCPSGSYCPENSETPVHCPVGLFSSPEASECELCHPGYFCNENGTTAENMTSQFCLEGYECPLGTSEPRKCQEGQYSGIGFDSCLDCEEGYYCPFRGTTTSIMYANECSAMFMCPVGSVNQTECIRGWFSNERMGTCSKCGRGFRCPGSVLENPPQIHSCSRDELCPEGSVEPGILVGVVNGDICPPGTYSNYDLTDCEPCSSSYFCPNNGTDYFERFDSPCSPGYFCSNGSSTPVPCTDGEVSEEGFDECLPCPVGRYSNEDHTVCELCPVNHYCPDVGEMGYSNRFDYPCLDHHVCPFGILYECPNGTVTDQNLTKCVECLPGTYSSEDLMECLECPAGYYMADN